MLTWIKISAEKKTWMVKQLMVGWVGIYQFFTILIFFGESQKRWIYSSELVENPWRKWVSLMIRLSDCDKGQVSSSCWRENWIGIPMEKLWWMNCSDHSNWFGRVCLGITWLLLRHSLIYQWKGVSLGSPKWTMKNFQWTGCPRYEPQSSGKTPKA